VPALTVPITLTTNIADVPGVGPKRANAFRKIGIRGVADLLLHMPMRYERQIGAGTIAEASDSIGPIHKSDAMVSLTGEVASARAPLNRRHPFEATLFDGSGTIKLSWFNSPWMKGKLHPGARIKVTGKMQRHGDYLQMVNPKWEAINETHQQVDKATSQHAHDGRLIPVYHATDSLPSAVIHDAVEAILDQATSQLADHLAGDYRKKNNLPSLAAAYRMVHRPTDEDEIKLGRRRLAFDELLLLELGVMMKRFHRHDLLHAPQLKHTKRIAEHIEARIPFTLTGSQRDVVAEIAKDLQDRRPMNRLLQGDVGAGKTVVALYAMLMAVASGHQAALMAPTELLAEQHFASITSMLKGGRVSIELLTGSLKAAQKKAIIKRLESGEIDIVIGTHALLTEHVNFKSLAVAVIDEQHRFGVHQRARLRSKSSDRDSSPHILVMTATPIPRTLSLTIFGDLDISTIKGLPPGRKPIATRHMPQARVAEVYEYVGKRLDAGEQAYIVLPVIDESASGLKDIESHMKWLSDGPLKGKKLAAMHGRLDRDERDAVMQRFRKGQIDALVATTVIEVGVDVPNATMMVIEHADRFGLAQLHQLRGRVGRSDKKSLCVLIADPVTDDGKARIEAIVASNDGFQIAEKDLEIRGPGELFGAKQAGIAPFRVAELPGDLKLLQWARRDAEKWIKANPSLAGERDALLRKRLLKAHGEALGLGDVA
jgi:ATP-dependent DNA helicase RecG